MNDDNTDSDRTPAASPRKRTVAMAAAVGVAGLLAGGLAAGTLSAASADTGSSDERVGHGVQRDGYGGHPQAGQGEGPAGRMGGDCPDAADRGQGGGDADEQERPPAPPSEQDPSPST